jgi:succinyl-CoA synthetase beta subunit
MGDPRIVESVSQAYLVPVIDYHCPARPRAGDGLLLAVGAGLLMATMDCIPRLRWCVDVGGEQRWEDHARNRLHEWLVWMNREVAVVVVHAWFSVSDPGPIARAIRAVDAEKLVWKSNVPLGHGAEAADIRALAAAAARL